jgi:hypothetical protein
MSIYPQYFYSNNSNVIYGSKEILSEIVSVDFRHLQISRVPDQMIPKSHFCLE